MSATEDLVTQAKRKACYAAIDDNFNPSTDRVLGIGSGSTIVFCVERLQQLKEEGKLSMLRACIPTSFQSKQLIIEAGLPLGDLNQFPEIDTAFDGADEIDPLLNCIKGGGACHLQEKLVAAAAAKFVLVADYRKISPALGTLWKQGIPLEVVPTAYVPILKKLKSMGAASAILRMAVKKAGPVVTDNGNFVIDADFGPLEDPRQLDKLLIAIPGIVETGLFCGMAGSAYYGTQDGSVQVLKA